MTDPKLIFGLSLAALPLAIVIRVFARRGKRINDHPSCAKCGFDLFGKPPESTVCSECGANLRPPRAIRTGQRQRYETLALLALLLALLSASTAVISGWRVATTLSANDKPTWWLLHDAHSSHATITTPAMAELISRLEQNTLSDGQAKALSERIMEIPMKNWPSGAEWGSALISLRTANQVSEHTWTKFCRTLGSLSILSTARPVVRHGDRIPISFYAKLTGMGVGLSYTARYHPVSLKIDGIPCKIPKDMQGGWSEIYNWATQGTPTSEDFLTLSKERWDSLSHGSHQITGEMVLTVSEVRNGRQMAILSAPIICTFNVVRSDAPTLALLTDSKLEPSIRQAVVPHIRANYWSGNDWGVSVDFADNSLFQSATHPPISSKVYLKIGTEEWPLGNALIDNQLRYVLGRDTLSALHLPKVSSKTADIILRPDVRPAIETVDVTQIWGKEITFKDVPIEIQK